MNSCSIIWVAIVNGQIVQAMVWGFGDGGGGDDQWWWFALPLWIVMMMMLVMMMICIATLWMDGDVDDAWWWWWFALPLWMVMLMMLVMMTMICRWRGQPPLVPASQKDPSQLHSWHPPPTNITIANDFHTKKYTSGDSRLYFLKLKRSAGNHW